MGASRHAHSGRCLGGLRLSPDGRFLASSLPEAPPASGTVVFVTAVGDGKPHKEAWSPEDAYVFGWSPDGQQLLYVSDQSGSYDLWAVPVKDAEPRGVPVLLKKELGMVHATGIADDGSLHYATLSRSGDVYLGELAQRAGCYPQLAAGACPSRELRNENATWSPDGSRLLMDRTSYQIGKGSTGTQGIIRDVGTGTGARSHAARRIASRRTTVDPIPIPVVAGWQVNCILDSRISAGPSQIHRRRSQTGIAKSRIEVPVMRPYVNYLLPTVAPDGRQVYIAKGGNMANASRVVRIDTRNWRGKGNLRGQALNVGALARWFGDRLRGTWQRHPNSPDSRRTWTGPCERRALRSP